MAVRGLGCPVRFALTAGHRGDAPQAAPLIEGLAAKVVMADTAYDSDQLRRTIAQKGAIAVIPNNPSRALKHPSMRTSTPNAIWSNAASPGSSNSDVSPPASRRLHATT